MLLQKSRINTSMANDKLTEAGKIEVEEILEAAGHLLGKVGNVKPIGRGGMAAVFSLEKPLTPGKAYKIEYVGATDKDFFEHFSETIERFQNEERIYHKLMPDSLTPCRILIAPLRDDNRGRSIPILEIPLVQGECLANKIAKINDPIAGASIKAELTQNLFLSILALTDALELLHQKNIVHGDINIGNFIISDDFEACLIDFAASALTGEPKLKLTIANNYVAPECLRQPGDDTEAKIPADPSQDIYSFAILLDELIGPLTLNIKDFPEYTGLTQWIQDAVNNPAEQRPSLQKLASICKQHHPARELFPLLHEEPSEPSSLVFNTFLNNFIRQFAISYQLLLQSEPEVAFLILQSAILCNSAESCDSPTQRRKSLSSRSSLGNTLASTSDSSSFQKNLDKNPNYPLLRDTFSKVFSQLKDSSAQTAATSAAEAGIASPIPQTASL
jgi:serine/threonine protein kinase